MKEQNKLRLILGFLEKIIIDFCTITGISGLTIYQITTQKNSDVPSVKPSETTNMLKWFFDFTRENFFILCVVTIIIAIIVELCIIPYYKIYKKRVSPYVAKPSLVKIVFMGVFLLMALVGCIINDSTYASDDNSKPINDHVSKVKNNAENIAANDDNADDNKNTDYDNKNSDDILFDDSLTKSLTLEEEMISEYIIKCYDSIVPIEEWSSLSASQVKYIYNGILAYSGMHFPSRYYERFEWYEDKYPQKDFPWKILNSFQIENLNNLRAIRVQMGDLVLE